MTGMSRTSGGRLGDRAHLHQSIVDILTTPVGTRVMRRDYGSQLPRLVDSPMHPGRYVDFYAAAAEALNRWEPRFALERVEIAKAEPGVLVLSLHGVYLPDGQTITLEGVTVP